MIQSLHYLWKHLLAVQPEVCYSVLYILFAKCLQWCELENNQKAAFSKKVEKNRQNTRFDGEVE